MDPSSSKYTAFVVPDGQFEFLKTPFGLCNSPGVFQRFINDIFREDIQEGIVSTYLDDIILPAKNEDEAFNNLKLILQKCQDYGLEINWSKTKCLQNKIEYLGHIIEDGKVRPGDAKIKAVSKFPVPTTTKQIQQFLGLTGFFRKFIRDYSRIAKPLSDLLRKDSQFVFGLEQQKSFQNLKDCLINEPVLNIYRSNAETQLHTDASSSGFGAVLLQKNSEDSKFHPVYYMSQKTTPAEEKYHSYELEVLAVVKALEKFKIYLHGIKFKIFTDCKAFTQTMTKKNLSPKIARWALFMQDFDFEIEF